MPGVGVGGLFANLFNPGLDDRLAQHITPNPNPLAQQGGPAAPGSVDALGNPSPSKPPPGSNLAPPAVTQPDPANAANVAALTQPSNAYAADALRAHRMDALSADLNQNLQGVAAGFGTAQQQASKQAALRAGGGGVGDSLAALKDIQGLQDTTITDNEHARFMANAHIFAQTLSQSLGRPVSDQEATTIMNSPDLMKSFGTAAGANATTTSTEKDAEAATREWAAAHPKATPQEIADYKANLIAGGMGGSDLEQRQYLQEKSSGITTDDFATWKAKKAAQATTLTTQAKASQDFKDTATQDYTANNTKLTNIQSYIDTLNKDPGAAQEALKMFTPTTGKWGAINPLLPTNVAAAAVALQKLQAELRAESLSGVKNVRNAREFNTLGQAATGGLDASASLDDFTKAVADLKNKFLDTQATNELAVGHKLTGNLVGHGSSDLLSPTRSDGTPNPYYNGGSEDGQVLQGDDLAQVQKALAQHPEKREQILDQVRKNGYTPRGL
jgi:hypothetical protein